LRKLFAWFVWLSQVDICIYAQVEAPEFWYERKLQVSLKQRFSNLFKAPPKSEFDENLATNDNHG